MTYSVHRTARQARSRDTEDRIVAAARDLLRKRGMEAVTMQEIAVRAGVSIGGLYARFPSKDSLAAFLADRRVFEELERESAIMIDDDDATIEQIVRRYLTTAAALYRKNRSVLRAVYVATRAGTDEALRARVREFNQALHRRLRMAILARHEDIEHPRPEVAVGLAILQMMATLREVVLFGQPVNDLVKLSEGELIDELTRSFTSYVGVKRSKR